MVWAATAALEATEPRTPTRLRALTQAEATLRLRRDGPNQLAQRRGSGLAHTVLSVVAQPMILLLIAAGVVYLIFGDREEAVLLLASISLIKLWLRITRLWTAIQ